MIREETRYMTDGKDPESGNPVLLSQAIGDAIAWRCTMAVLLLRRRIMRPVRRQPSPGRAARP